MPILPSTVEGDESASICSWFPEGTNYNDGSSESQMMVGNRKPWRLLSNTKYLQNHSDGNVMCRKKRKVKLRRAYANLDQHQTF